MSSDVNATAALIVHRQAEFTRQFSRTRSQSFASSVADRFFSDNSLDRQRRVIECTKRRQAKAQQKALEQELELHQLEHEYEHKQRLRQLQNERESSRMRRKLQHVAAAYIQYIYRKHLTRRRRDMRRYRAAQLLAASAAFYWKRRRRVRMTAALCIQEHWRRHLTWMRERASLSVLIRFIWSLVLRRRHKRDAASRTLQRWLKAQLNQRRSRAAYRIQRAWRASVLRLRVSSHARVVRRVRQDQQRDSAARLIQITLGRFAVRNRVLQRAQFGRFEELRRWVRAHSSMAKRPAEVWAQQRQLLAHSLSTTKRLQSEESTLLSEIEALQVKLAEMQAKKGEEHDRLKRYVAWMEIHRAKEEEQMREQLHDWEMHKRFEIRLELERELELERRIRSRVAPLQPTAGMRASQEDARVEVG